MLVIINYSSASFIKHVYFPIMSTNMVYTSKWVNSSWIVRWKKHSFMIFLLNPIKGVTLALLHKSDMWSLKLKFLSILHLIVFQTQWHLLCIVSNFNTGLLILTNTWNLSTMFFKRLFLNQLNKSPTNSFLI